MEVFDQIIDVFDAFKDGRRTACVSSQACIPAKLCCTMLGLLS